MFVVAVGKVWGEVSGKEIGLRFNPGLGSGGTGKTNVGGPSSSFGIWYELLPKCQEIVAKYNLKVERIHTHIGSGSDPAVWQKVSGMSLDLCEKFPDVVSLNLGGGYKVGRMEGEKSTDLSVIGESGESGVSRIREKNRTRVETRNRTGNVLTRQLVLGGFHRSRYRRNRHERRSHVYQARLRHDQVLRPSLCNGAQHPLINVTSQGELPTKTKKYVVVGHCCSGDLMTPAPDEPETISERELGEISIGDLVVYRRSSAYCAGMSSKNYNTFPEAPEVDENGRG